jgi:group II intron reverse transcriptase/maturase
MGTELP